MARLPENEPIRRVGDDTVDGHTGRSVSGTARHRDPVRSTHRDAAGRYGHTGVVLAIRVTFPFATRAWALPILVDRDRSEDDDRKRHRLHRTPAQILCRLVRLVMIRIPGRRVRFAGDSGFGTHAVARFCRRHPTRLTRVSQRHPDANRPDPPPPDSGKGRPRVTGSRRAKPAQAAGPAVRRDTRTVSGYGGGQRNVAVVGDAAHGFNAGHGRVPIRWVSARDQTGTHRDAFFYATDPTLEPVALIRSDGGRRNSETTVQEMRAHLGLETTRGAVRANRDPSRPVLVWAGLGGGPDRRGDPTGTSVRIGCVARQGDGDLFRCLTVCPAADLVRRRFATGRRRRGSRKTSPVGSGTPTQHTRTRRGNATNRHQPS